MSNDQTFKKIVMKELLTYWSWMWLFILWGCYWLSVTIRVWSMNKYHPLQILSSKMLKIVLPPDSINC